MSIKNTPKVNGNGFIDTERGESVRRGREPPEQSAQGVQNGETGRKLPELVTLKDRLAHFTWPWFATTMSTGALAVVLADTPNRFPGLDTIGKIFFIVDLVLFIVFTALMAARFVLAPGKLSLSLHHPVEGLFFGAYWVSVSLILDCTHLYGVPSSGPWLLRALEVLFWMYCGIVLLVAVGQYYVLFQKERLNVANAMPAWIFPIYPLLVIGPMAYSMISSESVPHPYPVWVGAVMLQGLAWTVALMMYCIYMQRLMTSNLPLPSTRPGMYVSVGPAGYTATGLIALGLEAPNVVSSNELGMSSVPDGEVIKVLGIMAGSFVILFAFWFFCVSTIAVINGLLSREEGPMKFTLNWWAFIFPNAGLTMGTIQLGKAFQSHAINGISSALTILLVILWILVAVFHIRALLNKEILWPGKDEDKDMKVSSPGTIGWRRLAS